MSSLSFIETAISFFSTTPLEKRIPMRCPECGAEMTDQLRHGIAVQSCSNDHGMWFTMSELDELENEAFSDEEEKGSLMLSSTPSKFYCPACNSNLKQFDYRMYDLVLEYCENKHGFWLDAGEDDRILELMKERKRDEKRKFDAEAHWQSTVRHLQSHSLFAKLKDLMKG